jgi:opacity protein-like surface antigen
MRIRVLAFLLGVALALPVVPVSAQRTGDRARLVFTISAAYIGGTGLWTIPAQTVDADIGTDDSFFLSRSINGTFGAGLSGTYYSGEHIGLNADAFLIGLGYDDSCRLNTPPQSAFNQDVCEDINRQDRSAAAVVLSAGAVFRVASRELISPFARVGVGLLISNQSSVLTEGQGLTSQGRSLLIVYDDAKDTRVAPALQLGVGATVPIGKGLQLRWEVRDNIVGIERVTSSIPAPRFEPPHERVYKNLFSILIGVDVILERQRGRRY